MIKFTKELYKYTKLFYEIYNYVIYYSDLRSNVDKIDEITELISDCGPVAIKFCQWITPKVEAIESTEEDGSYLVNKLKDEYVVTWIYDVFR